MLLVVVRAHYPNTPLDQNNAWLGRHKGSPQLSKDKLVSVPYGKHSCCCLSGFEMPNSKTLVIKTPRLDIGHTIAVVTPTHGIDNGQPVCNWCCRPPGRSATGPSTNPNVDSCPASLAIWGAASTRPSGTLRPMLPHVCESPPWRFRHRTNWVVHSMCLFLGLRHLDRGCARNFCCNSRKNVLPCFR